MSSRSRVQSRQLAGPQTMQLPMGGRVGSYLSYFWLVEIFLGFEIEVVV